MDRDIEFATQILVPDLTPRHPAHVIDGAVKNAARERIELDLCQLAGLDIVAVAFVDLAVDFHLSGVDDLRNATAGFDLIPFAVVGQRHPRKKELVRASVLLDGNQPIHGGGNLHFVDVLLRLSHCQIGFVPFLLGEVDCGLSGCGV